MSHEHVFFRRVGGRSVRNTVALLVGCVSLLAAPALCEEAETAVATPVEGADSAANQEATVSGWIKVNRYSTPPWLTAPAKIVWTSPGGGSDNVLPVIGPRLSLLGHFKTTSAVVVSPDGKLLASSAKEDRVVRLWSLEDGKLVSAYGAHADRIYALAFSPDGRWLASGSADKTVFMREVTRYDHREYSLDHPRAVRDLAFSPDGRWLATVGKDPNTQQDSGPNPITLWDTRTRLSKWQDSGDIPYSAVFSPDSKTVAVGGHRVTLWDVDTGTKRLLTGEEPGWRHCCGFSADGKLLLISDNAMVRLLNVADGRVERTFSGNYFGRMEGVSAALSPDGKTVASRFYPYKAPLILWDVATGRPRAACVPEEKKGGGLTFAPDGKSVVAGVGSSVFVWDVPPEAATAPPALPDLRRLPPEELTQPKDTLKGEYSGGVTSLSFSADGQYLAAGTYNGPVQVWNVESSRLEKELSGHNVRIDAVAFSPDGRILASGGQKNNGWQKEEPTRIWQWERGRTIRELDDGRHTDHIRSLSFSNDGKSLLELRSGPKLIRWDLVRGEPEEVGVEMENWHRIVAVSPAGDRVAVDPGGSASHNFGQVAVWDVATGKQVFTTEQWVVMASLAYSPDSRTLAVGLGESHYREGFVKLVDANTGALQASLDGHLGPVHAIAFSPDGKLVASGSEDMTIRLWDRSTGNLRVTIPAHRGAITCLKFSPEGKLLASGSLDDSIKMWQTSRLIAERSD